MRMFPIATFTLAAAALFSASGALAQPGQLDQLSACRLDPDRIVLRFTFEGGACQQPGEVTVEPAEGGVANVTVPTEEVGDVCTMQIVPVEFESVLDAPEEITALDISVLNPQGEPQALGSSDILTSGPECIEPEAAAAE
jgi:hypothetical protein